MPDMIGPHMIGMVSVLLGTSALAAFQDGAPVEHRFSIRADLGSAKDIDSVLGRIAEPVEIKLPPGSDAAAVLKQICGARAPSEFELVSRAEPDGRAQFVRYRPCLREANNLTTRVTPGDTLEAIAVRFGMRASSIAALTVRSREGLSKSGSKTRIAPGDRVVATKAPDWTSFSTQSPDVPDRAALVQIVAKAVGCGSQPEEPCLASRNILVVEEKPVHDHRLPPVTPGPGMAAAKKHPQAKLWAAAAPAGPRLPLLVAAAAPPLTAATAETAPIDPRQWPYDADLVSRILAEDAASATGDPNIFIGVAENGLGDKYGRPLGIAAFVRRTSDYPASNGEDDDQNNYVDDWIGAGVKRGQDEIMASGDVSLCPASSQIYASWQAPRLQRMSHGSIVASLASGGNLPANATLAPVLPELLFFRMAKKVCTDADDDGSGEREAIAAVDYLVLREARVLNLSFFSEGTAGDVLRDRLVSLMHYDPPLLVLPAGNYISENLDLTGDCPACLGNATRYSDLARLTLVVGAANRDRKIAEYSGYGVQTVKIYAPGEPAGSLDLAGRSGDALQPATSYAAPRVSFAAGLLQSLGLRDIPKVRNRLLLSTWPLHPDSRQQSDGSGGILDLVKAAAVRHNAIEVVEPDASGAFVRHTYVGKISGGLQGICPGYAISEASTQAVRFGEPEADGYRSAQIIQRQVDPSTREPRTRTERCRSTGALQLEAIRDGHLDLNLAAVRLILFRGIYP